MAVHASRMILIAAFLIGVCGCKPQFGSVTVTNATTRSLTEINVELPDLKNDFNNTGVAVARMKLAPGESKDIDMKGLPSGKVLVSWTEPDGTVVTANATVGDTARDVTIVIQEDGSIQVERGTNTKP